MGSGKLPQEQLWVEEYKALQTSAEHHDTLLWTATSIIWGGTLLLFGSLIEKIPELVNNMNWAIYCLFIFISHLGIFLLLAVLYFACDFRKDKKLKYDRCKEIEEKLCFYNHRHKREKPIKQFTIYIVITIIFILAWILIMLTVSYCWILNHHCPFIAIIR